ncbi:ABC transporter ATP-binding protein [bacterium]|nr:ABC transporter ATP-binding protein [candidate division CSSED10-310 bacterium]
MTYQEIQPANHQTDLLRVNDLVTVFNTEDGIIRAVDNVFFNVNIQETLGLVGESGCGKSVTSLSIMRLVPDPPGKVVQGEILFQKRDLLKLQESEMRKIRGKEISMIFQEPMTSLNPVFTIGDQISETIILHEHLSRKAALLKAVEMLNEVSIPDPQKRIREYPHQLSGGMRQRVMIAMALSCHPKLLIADEPTTALDVTIQAQILDLLAKLKQDFQLSMLLITHDLGVVAEVADRVAVMYAGKIVEQANVRDLYAKPLHPYTQGLLRSVPRLDHNKDGTGKHKLQTIEGTVPNLAKLPSGCAFASRCPRAQPICKDPERMILTEPESKHWVRCVLYQ